MSEIAEETLTGIRCAGCGIYLHCDKCEEEGLPTYCSITCALEYLSKKKVKLNKVCKHNKI